MGNPQPLAVSEKTAAKMMDMTVKQFRHLVDCGSLPPPAKIGGDILRWRVADINAVLNGTAMDEEQITW
ncbi:MAG: helix-turn-helix transcriptional regulator [Leisingera sp.]